jgi:hypothetical protein
MTDRPRGASGADSTPSGRSLASGRVALALTAAVTAAGLLSSYRLVALVILPVISALLAIHLDRHAASLAESLVTNASLLLPRVQRDRWLDEWIDHIRTAGEHGVLPLTRAMSIAFIAAPALAVGLRLGRAQERSRKRP